MSERQSRFAAVGRLFEAALRIPAAERRAFLERADCDAETRAEAARLLATEDRAGDYFDGLIESVASGAPSELRKASREHRRIGPYRTLQSIGRGGMGSVFLAERDDGQFEQRVAVKLIRRGMDDAVAIERFLAERQILARLQHVGIARLLDGGVSEDGRPYFVMEYVEGTPITSYCDERRATIDDRLRLVAAVGDAAHYAHRNLVIHRDLKPSNILVTVAGECRLLDFGIAKLLADDEETTAAAFTVDRIMTPLYAAPEQIRGEPVTTATDVFSLGVVLYELLTGDLPWDRQEGPGFAEALDREPRRLTGGLDAEVAADRSTSLRRLRRRLAGDLETICRKALSVEPERRYPSMDQFVADIRRFLDGMPVVARRSTVAYRVRRFVRRHPWGVAAAVSALVLSVTFGVVMAVQSARLARERDKARRVTDLIVDLFQVSDPALARGESLTAREVLDRGVERLGSELEEQPLVRASLLDAAGRVYHALGLYDEAEDELRAALDSFRQAGDRSSADYARTLDRLGITLLARDRVDEAEGLFQEALELRSNGGRRAEELAESLQNMGAVSYQRGDFAAAEDKFRRAADIYRSRPGGHETELAASLNNLAAAQGKQGDYEAAEATYREVVALQRRMLGDDHPQLAHSLNNLAMILFGVGRPDQAEPLHREALAMRRRLLEPDHPELAQSLSNLGLVLQALGQVEESEALLRESLSVRRAALSEDHPLVAHSLNNLGLLVLAQGRAAEAEQLFREALGIVEKAHGEHLDVAISLNNLASSLEMQGRVAAAEASYRRALDMRRRVLPEGHPHVAYNLVGLGRLLVDTNRPAEAEPLLREAVAIREASGVATAAELAAARGELDRCLAALQPENGGVRTKSALASPPVQ